MNGPVPTGCADTSLPNFFSFSMLYGYEPVSSSGNGPYGLVMTYLTVNGSTTCSSLIGCSAPKQRDAGCLAASKFALITAESSAVPSWNLMPSRNLSVHS